MSHESRRSSVLVKGVFFYLRLWLLFSLNVYPTAGSM